MQFGLLVVFCCAHHCLLWDMRVRACARAELQAQFLPGSVPTHQPAQPHRDNGGAVYAGDDDDDLDEQEER